MRRLTPALTLSLLAVLGCRSQGEAPPHTAGAEAFLSPPPGIQSRSGTTAAQGGAALPSAAAAEDAAARAVEEADVYKLVGTTLYVLNAYRGLQIVDLSDLSKPRLVSRAPVTGTPVDLYLRGAVAFVAVSDAFGYVVAEGGARPQRGSRVYAVDVSDPARPAIVADLPLEGQLEQTRLVGDVLYVVSRKYPWYDWSVGVAPGGAVAVGAGTASSASDDPTDKLYVASFDVADPAHPVEAARIELPASGWDTHAHVTAERITLSFAGWEQTASGYGAVTRFQVVDISDPNGALKPGAAFEASGQVRDRWSMDFDAGTGLFRAVLASGTNAGASVEIWSAPGPGGATWLNRYVVQVSESLTAARFDGSRAYVVTARTTDPLWIVDTADPMHPVASKPLEMPGQLEFIEPRGDRLLALGHEQPFQLVASLIDVSVDPPAERSRVGFGSGWSWVGAQPDDLRKAFLVLEPTGAPGLILVPVQGWDQRTYAYRGGTQLVSFDLAAGALTLGGFLEHPGAVKRAFPANASATRLVALSDSALQAVDASSRAAPAELARIDLARSVSTLALVNGKAVELCGDWYLGEMSLAVTDALDPESSSPLARVDVAAPSARMFQDGHVLWLLAHDWTSGEAWLQAVDFADPGNPVLRGRVDLASGAALQSYMGAWGAGGEAAQAGHALAVHATSFLCAPACSGGLCDAACHGAATATDEVRVYDLSDPDHPRLASTVTLDQSSWSWGLQAAGSQLWLTQFEWQDGSQGRYYLVRIDLSDPSQPKVAAKVNVPGVFFAASADGNRVYTLETFWKDDRATTWAHGLELTPGGTARLRGSARLNGYPAGAAAGADFAWIATTDWSSEAGASRLSAVNLGAMTLASEQAVQGSWAWLDGAAGGKLFLQASWTDQGILVYDLDDPARPAFDRFFRTNGWVWDIVVGGGYAYLPSGPYGVPMIPLSP